MNKQWEGAGRHRDTVRALRAILGYVDVAPSPDSLDEHHALAVLKNDLEFFASIASKKLHNSKFRYEYENGESEK